MIKLLRAEVGQKPPMLRFHRAILSQPALFCFALLHRNYIAAHPSHKIPVAIVYRRGYIAPMDKQNMTAKEAATLLVMAGGRIRQLVPASEVYGKCGRPMKAGIGGGVSTATNAPDDGMSSAVTGQKMARQTWKKATTKASKR